MKKRKKVLKNPFPIPIKKLTTEDLNAIAFMHRIIMNHQKMKKLISETK